VRALAGLGVVVALAGACDDDRATVFEAVGDPAFDFGISVIGTGNAAIPRGTATVAGPAVTVSLANLKALGSGQYQFWVLRRDASNLDVTSAAFGTVVEFFLRLDIDPVTGDTAKHPVTGDPLFVTDSTIVSAVRTDGYSGTDDPAVTSVRVIMDSTADGSQVSANQAVFVTVESAAATTPSSARFLWRRTGVGGSGALSFGNFSGSDDINTVSPSDYVYATGGGGLGGVRGDEISADFRDLPVPPMGFFYQGYIVDTAGVAQAVDTLRTAWSPDETVSRTNLHDADLNPLLPGIAGRVIRTSQVRNCRAGSTSVLACPSGLTLPEEVPFGAYAGFLLVLEPKGGTSAMGRAATMTAELPEEARQ
jgi:hypothetical protein